MCVSISTSMCVRAFIYECVSCVCVCAHRIPLKHGRSSSYPYLLLEFRATQESLVDLNMTDEEIKHYNDINNSSLIQVRVCVCALLV
jgi:hypothetical protein